MAEEVSDTTARAQLANAIRALDALTQRLDVARRRVSAELAQIDEDVKDALLAVHDARRALDP
jgi:hypothetical protein